LLLRLDDLLQRLKGLSLPAVLERGTVALAAVRATRDEVVVGPE